MPVVAFSGRYHLYEGHDIEVPALLPRLAHVLGARTMVLTAAVGGLVAGVAAGTVVVVRDHMNMMGDRAAARVAIPRWDARVRQRRGRL